MKKRFMTVAIICALISSISMSSCIGNFALTNKLLDWNQSIDNKFVNEVVFFVFWVLPVYEVAALADVLVLNSIEFWTGEPALASTKVIEGQDGKYLVESDSKGYTVTSLNDNSKIRLNYEKANKSWSVVGKSGKEYPLMTYVDDTHLMVPGVDGEMMLIEKSQAGLYAYQQAITSAYLFANK